MRMQLFTLREAAGVVLLGQPTTSSASPFTWCHKNKAAISALHRTTFHNSFSNVRPGCYDWGACCYQCAHTQPTLTSASIFFVRKHSYSTAFATKAPAKTNFSTKPKSRSQGKIQKQGSTTRRPLTVSAFSRQKANFSERRSNKQPSATLSSEGASSRTLLQRRETSRALSDSNSSRSSNQPQIKKSRSTEAAALNVSRNASVTLENLKKSNKEKNDKGKPHTQEMGSQKKGKRVMKLDPKDTTSKRFYDGYPLPGENVQEETPAALSGREEFRHIVPPPKLIQHIERHMLGRRRPSELQKAGYNTKISPAPLDNIPHAKKGERGERQPIQEEVFRHKLRFAAAAKSEASLPALDLPEVAFAGRSNVGKSSLINALTRQWGVARTSDKPGQTQSINFFRLGGRLCLVDLPGYGFAYAAEEKKEAWEEFVREFVQTRAGLKRVYVLVDAKWGLKLKDEELVQLMEKAGTKYQIVLTKSDTVTPMDLARRATQIIDIFKGNKFLMLPMIMVSSRTGEGLEFFRGHVAKLANASLI